MTTTRKMLAFTLTLSALCLCLAPAAFAADAQTMEGEFVWERTDKNITGPLKAIFEPTEEADTWNVSFHFTFEGKAHTYSGTAKGELGTGALEGEVMSDGEKPAPFVFEGTFTDGKFSGTHAGFRDGNRRPTGSMTLGG
ncbi:MAG: hypothetical protein AAFX50_08805 [Acidobacteriota bacterium]